MTVRSVFLSPKAALLAGAGAVAVTWVARGPAGAEGMAIGIVGGAFNLVALWKIIGLLCNSQQTPKPGCGAFLTVLAFFVKLPLILGLGYLSYTLGTSAMSCFLLGVGLVYSALLGWVIARGDGPP